jgi:hypothetical protein
VNARAQSSDPSARRAARARRRDFDQLVERIERRYADKPWRLRVRTALLVALGFAGFLFWFLLLGGIGVLLFVLGVTLEGDQVFFLIALGAILLTLGIVQALQFAWIPIEPDKARVLTRAEVPVLFECLDRLQRQTGAARLDRVETNWDFNAGVCELPRLGFFGWSRHHLRVGLPLLEALSPSESVAVLAHELAHLSARHDRFGMWIYRLQRTWGRLIEQMSQPATSQTGRGFRSLIAGVINWYWPLVHAYAFVLSRSNEYVADRVSADCIGADEAGNALWKIACFDLGVNQKFWTGLWQRATNDPNVPEDVIAEFAQTLREPPAPCDAARACEKVSQCLTDHADTHPCFAERVRALGLSPDQFLERGFPRSPHPSAAEFLFGENLPQIRRETSALWREDVRSNWQARYSHAAVILRQITAIAPGKVAGPLAPEVLWEKAQKVLSLGGSEKAEPLLRELVALKPTHSAANLVLGKHLLDRLDANGASYLQRIIETEDDGLIPEACAALTSYFQAVGHAEGAQSVRNRLHRYQMDLENARKERSQVRSSDSFRPHELPTAELNEIIATLRSESVLEGAWLVQKELLYFPKQRLFVLAVRTATNMWGRSNSAHDSQLVNRLVPRLRLPGSTLVIGANGMFRKLAQKVMASPDSRIV